MPGRAAQPHQSNLLAPGGAEYAVLFGVTATRHGIALNVGVVHQQVRPRSAHAGVPARPRTSGWFSSAYWWSSG